ncbi:MAG TPA: aminotransferase class V-fold PLP-dependent enzyme [Gemmatales bacterium]|nr:aminotransferase class V-fold PLP-dependent enzyme [Gemmatales bacterium]HMP60020.1 aminotransferase class V-fold PLP-dependent enzyme [Gemmatales bacterium]
MDDLLQWRSEFPILDQTTYLISHSLGAMPRRTRERLNEYADVWSTRGIRAWSEGWWEMPRSVGDLVGCIIGAVPGEVIMHQNVSVGASLVMSCFDFRPPRNQIVTESLNFPSNLYLDHALERNGAEVVTVPTPDGITVPLEAMLEAITERTQIVSLSHVIFKSAFIQDLAAIIAKAQAVGAYVLADLYQSAGTVPLHVGELGLDFATGGSVKWLLGGPGAGYLYVRRDLWPRLEPKLTGWAAHAAPFNFEPGRQQYADDIYRFAHGSPAIPALYAARSGYEIIAEVGVERIRAKSQRQTALLIDLALAAGLKVNSPRQPERRGGTVVIDVPHGAQVVKELQARDVLVDYRPGAGLRASPHFYTRDDELERLIREVQDVLATRAYEKHPAGAAH